MYPCPLKPLITKQFFKDQFDGFFLFNKAILKRTELQLLFNVYKVIGFRDSEINSLKFGKSDHSL